MKKVITYGTYDLLHYGHIALLERAKKLGDYLIVGVTSDVFDKNRGKLNVQQSVVERIEAIQRTGLADEIIIEEYEGQKIADIKKYNVDIFAIGSDWTGKFDYLSEYCEVVYLKRTEGISSTKIRGSQNKVIKMGMVGTGNPTERVIQESLYVSGLEVTAVYDESVEKREKIRDKYGIMSFDRIDDLLNTVDAVYINELVSNHVKLIESALRAGCHVICENPLCTSAEEARRLFQIAKDQDKVLLEAVKTLFFPAFEHLMLIVNSGVIGEICDIDVSCSQIPEKLDEIQKIPEKGSMYEWGGTVLSAIVKLLGIEYESCTLYSYKKNEFDYFVRGLLKYKSATATFKIGMGVKTEGDMIITGKKGYIYVPAPWWKTDYFEVRYEDLRDSKKYFYQYAGEGFRYELLEFVKMIQHNTSENYLYTQEEILCVMSIFEQFKRKEVQILV